MKNIILQHWSGEINELGRLSSASISAYAKEVGADYRLLLGDVFRPGIGLDPPCQKMHMLNEEFDEYDMVVMTDMDMFVRKGNEKNIFTDTTGIGRHTAVQDRLVQSVKQRFPKLGNPKYPYWGGSVFRLSREVRQTLRAHIREEDIKAFSHRFHDEGIMHRLAVLADFKITEETYIPGSWWNCGSFEEGVEEASFIHIRTKIAPQGPKRDKIVNYRDLVNRGLIEE